MKRDSPPEMSRVGPAPGPLWNGPSIAALGIFVYLNALDNAFVYDDHRVVLENLSLRRHWDWYSLLWHDITRPFVNLTYALDYAVWRGPNPVGFHVTNVAIHVANILLLYRAAIGLAADRASARKQPESQAHTAAGAAALLFAVHPILTQAVGYVSARTELLCAMFLLMAFNTARGAMRGGSGWLWLVAIVSWILALASKEIAVMFPFALLIYDRLLSPLDGERRRRLWTVHVPLVGFTLIAAAVRLLVLVHMERGITTVPWRIGLVELDAFRRYLQMMVLPVGKRSFTRSTPFTVCLNFAPSPDWRQSCCSWPPSGASGMRAS